MVGEFTGRDEELLGRGAEAEGRGVLLGPVLVGRVGTAGMLIDGTGCPVVGGGVRVDEGTGFGRQVVTGSRGVVTGLLGPRGVPGLLDGTLLGEVGRGFTGFGLPGVGLTGLGL